MLFLHSKPAQISCYPYWDHLSFSTVQWLSIKIHIIQAVNQSLAFIFPVRTWQFKISLWPCFHLLQLFYVLKRYTNILTLWNICVIYFSYNQAEVSSAERTTFVNYNVLLKQLSLDSVPCPSTSHGGTKAIISHQPEKAGSKPQRHLLWLNIRKSEVQTGCILFLTTCHFYNLSSTQNLLK